jgi:hypothetical protein
MYLITLLGDFSAEVGREDIFKQSGIRVHTQLVTIIE